MAQAVFDVFRGIELFCLSMQKPPKKVLGVFSKALDRCGTEHLFCVGVVQLDGIDALFVEIQVGQG